ncbi:MAG TPA: AAA family ATPase [bacterium]|nr:AAA family ATPase [bacterium]
MSRFEEKLNELEKAFTPAAPINKREFFAGRVNEIVKVIDAVKEKGAHAIVYGERGVGKTSLANITAEVISEAAVIKTSCVSYDKYEDIWDKTLKRIKMIGEQRRIGYIEDVNVVEYTAREFIPEGQEIKPENVADIISGIFNKGIIIVDEFDRIKGEKIKRLMADTIKYISDNISGITLVIVGVALTVDELIGEHHSIERNLKQIKLERMKEEELKEIIDKGSRLLNMVIDDAVAADIVKLSQGFPHYTHLLSKYSAKFALINSRFSINSEDLNDAVMFSLKDVSETIRNAYLRASASTRATIFPEVILACALTKFDEYATFRAKDVEIPLSDILGQKVDITKFSYHLGKLINPDRGPLLERIGGKGRHRYRFLNPLMIPYIVLKGRERGLI